MVADHGKARCAVDLSVVVQNICEAPVHLVGFTGGGRIATTSVALWRNLLPFCGNEVLVGGNVVFDDGQSSLKARLQQTIQDHCGIADTLLQQCINNSRIAGELSDFMLSGIAAFGNSPKTILLESAKLPAGDVGASFKLSQIDLFQREGISLFCFHFFYGLCYTWHIAITV